MKNLDKIFAEYKKLNVVLSLEDEQALIYDYIYTTNKLEGNKLTLAQTTSIIEKGTVSGEDVSLRDMLEQKGAYKAVKRMLKAVVSKEPLSKELVIELNWLLLESLWKDDFYLSYKAKGQEPGQLKVASNQIKITLPTGKTEIIQPLSSPENAEQNLIDLINQVNSSTKSIIEKASFLAQEIWLHQPFIDGNKRTGRLFINFLLMKEGYPLFVYEDRSQNYNSLLVEQYMENKPGLIENYIAEKLIDRMQYYINIDKNKGSNLGFRMML
ncbi:MAG: Fic family protein [Flavobacteriaceae bacterium]